MKIEKKKITGKSQLSKATKVGAATLLGMTSVFFSACGGDTESGVPVSPIDPQNSSDSSTDPENESSSSALDIPLSQEHLSSSSQEALSSSSSELAESSSSEVSESSSSEKTESSSSQVEESSSSVKSESSSSSEQSPYRDCAPEDQKCIDDWRCQHNDPLCPQIYMCDDPKDPRCMMVSMVSTYERTDIT